MSRCPVASKPRGWRSFYVPPGKPGVALPARQDTGLARQCRLLALWYEVGTLRIRAAGQIGFLRTRRIAWIRRAASPIQKNGWRLGLGILEPLSGLGTRASAWGYWPSIREPIPPSACSSSRALRRRHADYRSTGPANSPKANLLSKQPPCALPHWAPNSPWPCSPRKFLLNR